MIRDEAILRLLSEHVRRCADLAYPDLAKRLRELADDADAEGELRLPPPARPRRKRPGRSRTALRLVEGK